MGTETIIEKIREKAAAEIAAIEQAGQDKQAAIKQAAAARAEEQCRAIGTATDAQVEEIARRGTLMSGLEARKTTLAAKRTVLDEAFAQAKAQLLAMSAEEKAALLSRLIVNTAPAGVVRVRASRSERALFTDAQLAALSQQLSERHGVPCTLMLEAEAAFDGGVTLVTDTVEIDLSFDTLLHAVREQREGAVAKVLFPA